MSSLSKILYSIRPSACLGVALFATASLGQWDNGFIVALTFLCGFIGAAGCFLINDIFDREKDLKNNKKRPIATGELPVRTALIISVLCCLFMLVGAYYLNFYTLVISALLIVGFWFYSFVNQRFGFLANIWVAISSSMAFLFGAMVFGVSYWVFMAMTSSFFVNAGREILLDSLDQEGDRAVGKPSIPIRFGENRTRFVVSILFFLGSLVLLIFSWHYAHLWLWALLLLISLWLPFLMKREDFQKWALFNIRTSHLFFVILIVLLFLRP